MTETPYTPDTLRAAFSDPERYVLPPGSMTLEPEQVVSGKFADAWEADRIMLDGAGKTNDELWGRIAAAKAREEAEPRPQVRQFADLMEARLKANDHKAGWRGERLPYLFRRLREETDELFEAMRPSADWRMAPEAVGREAADVANFAMMIADICGALAASEPPGTREGMNPVERLMADASEPPGEEGPGGPPFGFDGEEGT